MNTDIKILKKIIPNQYNTTLKKMIPHDKVAFISGSQDASAYTNQSME